MSLRLPNDSLSEAKKLFRATKQGGKKSPEAFTELFQFLLSQTILAKGQSIRLRRLGGNNFIISGHLKPKTKIQSDSEEAVKTFQALQLKDKRYLYLYIVGQLDPSDNLIKVLSSRYYYQFDAEGNQLIFRFEYFRSAPDHNPSGHLHIHGHWPEKNKLPIMTKIHFPVGRPTLESIIRLLVNDFAVPTNTDNNVWRPILNYTEDEFLQVATLRRTKDSAEQ